MMHILLVIVVSLFFSAMFSGIEIAFVSSNKLRLELDKKQRNVTSKILELFYNKPNQFLSTLLVGNNIALVVYGIQMSLLVNPFLERFVSNEAIIVVIETLFSTAIILITAEFMPKTLFRIDSNLSLRVFAIPMFLCYVVLYPISVFATLLSKIVLFFLGVKNNPQKANNVINKVDLDYFIQSTIEQSCDSNKELDTEVKMFQNVLDFSTVKIRDCILPRTELVAVEFTTDQQELMTTFVESGLSKVLVYKENIDNVIGYIHSSEMFKKLPDWTKSIKPIALVPETMSANKLMRLLMQQKKSMVGVVDEFGGLSGIVTLEDLVEEILGDIEDEHDKKSFIANKISDSLYILSGRLDIDDINERFGLDLPEEDEYVTIAGLILHYYQSFPKVNETIEIGRYVFRILKAASTKIELVELKVKAK